ncbi:MAG: nuclear transport factor 2 family protein, partial [Actinomycetota bacterium]
TTPEITVDGDEATGIWAMTDLIVFPDGTRLDGAGHYHERYRRVDGRWLIDRSRLTRLRRDLT